MASVPPYRKIQFPERIAAPSARGWGLFDPSTIGASVCHAPIAPVFGSAVAFHTVFVGFDPSLPPMTISPSAAGMSIAPLRGAVSFRFGTSLTLPSAAFHAPSSPVFESGVRM